MWLEFTEKTRWLVNLTESPVVGAHPQLRQKRTLSEADLPGLGIVSIAESSGPLADVGAVPIDPRVERITLQQQIRLAVLRRDAAFELSGAGGTIVLSGNDLLGTQNLGSLSPIWLRAVLWLSLTILSLFLGILFLGANLKPLPYYQSARGTLTLVVLLGVAFSVPFVGGFLRELKRRARFGKMRSAERVSGGIAVACALIAVILAARVKPKLESVQTALASNQLSLARMTVDALVATQGLSADILNSVDEVKLAEAHTAKGDAKLGLLDSIAARGGPNSKSAAQLAHEERTKTVQEYLDQKNAGVAIKAIDVWFGATWKTDNDLSELRAKAEDEIAAECTTAPCRFAANTEANRAHSTPARVSALGQATEGLRSQLSFAAIAGESPAAHLHRLRDFVALGEEAATVTAADPSLLAASDKAIAFGQSERARVPLVGARADVLEELMGPLTTKTPAMLTTAAGSAALFFALDSQRNCRGIYAVGTSEGRSLHANGWKPEGVLSQAVGHSAALKAPSALSQTVTRWVEGGIVVATRWRDGDPIELRIGDAAP